jgi:hypothetical protein
VAYTAWIYIPYDNYSRAVMENMIWRQHEPTRLGETDLWK